MNTLSIILLFVAVALCLVSDICLYFMIKDRPTETRYITNMRDGDIKDLESKLNKMKVMCDSDRTAIKKLIHYLAKDSGTRCKQCIHYNVCDPSNFDALIDPRQSVFDRLDNSPLVLCNNYKEETNNGQSGTDENND